ncbi:LTA synthase family protein [Marinigracilibium pacificum]|uniref:Sulfatase-like hydrolase/transferase n=1 Tax=Marinigracilibium pacificum TaxID=2729599 RepID=A0A848J1U8_9BACT|nr:LTA synthase family protein [Marinigracilibium pacificum]NMM49475.1 sulfatase-like hydrolase/transferase [Marinigracilibium pacificum]
MKERFIYLAKIFGLFTLAGIFIRLVFLIFHFGEMTRNAGFTDVFMAFVHGIRMDFSIAGYILALPVLLTVIGFLIPNKIQFYLNRIILVIFAVVLSMMATVDIKLFQYWGFRLDTAPLLFLETPGEAVASLSIAEMIIPFLYLVILCSLLIAGVFRITKDILQFPKYKLQNSIAFLLLLGFLIIPIRGGVGIAPLNPGSVFFSNYSEINQLALNPAWNFNYTLSKYDPDALKKEWYDDVKADSILTEAYSKGPYMEVLNTKRPNILLIIIESMASKFMHRTYKGDTVTPYLDQLSREGIYFNNFYASGDRSHKGMTAIFSGFPAHPVAPVIKYPAIAYGLPNIIRDLKSEGYKTSYVYGGDLAFANFNGYFLSAGTDELITESNFPDSLSTTKWGVHDNIVSDTLLNHIKQKSSIPWFTTWFTLSNHPPYELPENPKFGSETLEDKVYSTSHFTDQQIQKVVDSLKSNNELWSDLLVIIMADHGVRDPDGSDYFAPETFQIPMIWTGGALNHTGFSIDRLSSQTDFAATLLGEMEMDYSEYYFSKNLFQIDYKPMAWYSFSNGYSLKVPNGTYSFSTSSGDFIAKDSSITEADFEVGQAYLQKVYKKFTEKRE